MPWSIVIGAHVVCIVEVGYSAFAHARPESKEIRTLDVERWRLWSGEWTRVTKIRYGRVLYVYV